MSATDPAVGNDGHAGVVVTEERGGILVVRLCPADRLNAVDRHVAGAIGEAERARVWTAWRI